MEKANIIEKPFVIEGCETSLEDINFKELLKIPIRSSLTLHRELLHLFYYVIIAHQIIQDASII